MIRNHAVRFLFIDNYHVVLSAIFGFVLSCAACDISFLFMAVVTVFCCLRGGNSDVEIETVALVTVAIIAFFGCNIKCKRCSN